MMVSVVLCYLNFKTDNRFQMNVSEMFIISGKGNFLSVAFPFLSLGKL